MAEYIVNLSVGRVEGLRRSGWAGCVAVSGLSLGNEEYVEGEDGEEMG